MVVITRAIWQSRSSADLLQRHKEVYMKNGKKLMSVLIAVIMLVAMLPASVFAQEVKMVRSKDSVGTVEAFGNDLYRFGTGLDLKAAGGFRDGESYTLSGIPDNVEITVDGVVQVPVDGTLSVPAGSTVVVSPAKDYVIRSFAVYEAVSGDEDPVVVLSADDVWGDGSGYQMLLDADATAYGDVIPVSGPLTTSGDAPAEVYKEFEYTIPKNADGSCSTTNIVSGGSEEITIPAGVYDWMITNPTPDDCVWIASESGDVPGRYDDFEFEAGRTYEFHVALNGNNDGVFFSMSGEVEFTYADGSCTFVMPASDAEMMCTVKEIVYYDHWDFEDTDAIEDWGVLDNDGDGYGWDYVNADGYEDYYHSATHIMMSYSYYSGQALEPDNWLISGPVIVPEESPKLSMWIKAYSSSYPDEVVGVYVARDLSSTEDFVQVGNDFTTDASWQECVVDLQDYAGEIVYFAIRHYNCYDQYAVLLDDVSIYSGEMPDPGIWDFEEAADLNGWTFVDADGDGYNWYRLVGDGMVTYSGTGVLTSASYLSEALFPDNWAITPAVEVPTVDPALSFYVVGQDPSWAAEHLKVYIGDSTDIDSMVCISGDDDIVATPDVEHYVFDLSDYAGQTKYFAFRHYNTTDMFRINIDDVEILGEGSVEPGDDVSVVPYPASAFTEGTDYSVEGNVVTVTHAVPCRVGYLDGYNYVAIPAVAVDGQENTYSFTVPEGVEEVILVVRGDSNLDGMFTNGDITFAKAASLGRPNAVITAEGAFAIDMNGDGAFSNNDITLAKAVSLGRVDNVW